MNYALKAILELCIEEDLLMKALGVLQYLVQVSSTRVPACYVQLCISLLVNPEYPQVNLQETSHHVLLQILKKGRKEDLIAWSFETELSDFDIPRDESLSLFSKHNIFLKDIDFWDLVAYAFAIPDDVNRWLLLLDIWIFALDCDAKSNNSLLMKEYLGDDYCELSDAVEIILTGFLPKQRPYASPFSGDDEDVQRTAFGKAYLSNETVQKLETFAARLLQLVWLSLPKGLSVVVQLTKSHHFLSLVDSYIESFPPQKQQRVFQSLGNSSLCYSLSQYCIMKGAGISLNIRHVLDSSVQHLNSFVRGFVPKKKNRQIFHLISWTFFFSSLLSGKSITLHKDRTSLLLEHMKTFYLTYEKLNMEKFSTFMKPLSSLIYILEQFDGAAIQQR
ncbi:Smc5-6 complex non-SMC subunit Nse5 [Schizosaccharomyces octosporus yFS286]|uniref:Smc5-6 complex non-SMC subunit Nse5 n=1 Tax=Schizosaccharomyces octosporus (strain yFS286) TaxID=483514 RepID=S9PYN7_SCHOY|nr:Smc5-6 complex non-SMC subunit Nse5 [Schizosaccharomyces octosporus yFS286]EPX74196.1 Smc5-6 complex non-SMC subunit Nse5 [Schizosaccharomyces octosporus yFS286]